MQDATPVDLAAKIRAIPDFPKPGILFRDIMPLLQDAQALRAAVDRQGGLIEQVMLPALRSRRGEQRQEALDALEELAQAMSQLEQLLLTRYIRRLTV